MPAYIVEFIFIFLMMLTVGTFVLLFPITRRLGRIMEDWVALRRGSLPDQEQIGRMSQALDNMNHRLEAIEQRVDLVGDRQEFMESLMDQQRLTGSSSDPA